MSEADDRITMMLDLFLAVGGKEVSEPKQALYLRHTADLPVEALRRAIDTTIRTKTFLPSIAELREAATAGLFAGIDPDYAWAEVAAEIRRVGFKRLPEFHAGQFLDPPKPTFSHPLIARAVQSIGWDLLCTGDAEYIRKQFVDTLSRQVKAARTEAQVNPPTHAMLEGGHDAPVAR